MPPGKKNSKYYYDRNPQSKAKKKKYDTSYHSTPARKKYRAKLNAARQVLTVTATVKICLTLNRGVSLKKKLLRIELETGVVNEFIS
jgi:hypothetical protein